MNGRGKSARNKVKFEVTYANYILLVAVIICLGVVIFLSWKSDNYLRRHKLTNDSGLSPNNIKRFGDTIQKSSKVPQTPLGNKVVFFKKAKEEFDESKTCKCVECEFDEDCGGLWSGKVVGDSAAFDSKRSFNKISFIVSYCSKSLDWFEDFVADIEPSQISSVTVFSKCGNSVVGSLPLQPTTISSAYIPAELIYLRAINLIYNESDNSKEAIIFLPDKGVGSRSLRDILRIMDKTGFGCGSEPKIGKSAYHLSEALMQWQPMRSGITMNDMIAHLNYFFPHRLTEVCDGSMFGATRAAIQEAPQFFWERIDTIASDQKMSNMSILRFADVLKKSWAGLFASPLPEYQVGALEEHTSSIDKNDGALMIDKETVAVCMYIDGAMNYTNEFLDYHFALGFNHVFIYESIHADAKKKLAKSGKVSFMEVLGKGDKLQAWHRCGHMIKQRKKYSWIAFLDQDEFVVLKKKERDIINILDKVPKAAGGLALNHFTFDYNNEIFYRPLPLSKRFQRREAEVDDKVSFIIRSGFFKGDFLNPHCFKFESNVRLYDTRGMPLPQKKYAPYNPRGPVDEAVVYHFETKSVEEFSWRCDRRIKAERAKPYCQNNTAILDRWKDIDKLLETKYVHDDSAWTLMKSIVPFYVKFDRMNTWMD